MQRRNECRCRFQSDRFIGFWRLSNFKRNNRREREFLFHELRWFFVKFNIEPHNVS
jgi:hypothetical protein